VTSTISRRQQAAIGRRIGYLIAVAINAVLLYLINVAPGWRAVPFLTDSTTDVLGLVNASLAVSLVVNLWYAVADPRRGKRFGDLVTSVVGLAALIRIWQVFPFDFTGSAAGWAVPARVLLVVVTVAASIGVLVTFVSAILAFLTPKR
jgi:hypothetical protein